MASSPQAPSYASARGESSRGPQESGYESARDAQDDDELEDAAGDEDTAPRFTIASRRLAAVEIPAVVNNIDRAVKAFGRVSSLSHVMDPLRSSLPFYLNPESPFCPSIMSHNARSHNVVLKITVPKRTGRKRKRGTNDPWQGDVEIEDASVNRPVGTVCSIARLDEPKVLRRKLADNADRYEVEAIGVIKHTHRFRGLADFYWDMSKSSFARRYVDQVLPGDIQKIKEFKFAPGVDKGPNVDIIPPPLFTHMTLPFNYNYSQNPYVRATEDGDTINLTAVKQVGYFIGADEPAPTGPQMPPDHTDPRTMEIIAELEAAFEDRPVWTRRSLLNHLGDKLRNWNELKKYLNYTAYQFKGGPWRDGVVPYGVDPRTDPKYRIYQTLMFKLARRNHRQSGWRSLPKFPLGTKQNSAPDDRQSHIFDGDSYCTDGKVWQVCDITDPLLKDLFDNAPVRPTWDVNSGWYHGGLWGKAKAIMKTKFVAIQFGKRLTRTDFAATLNCGDQTPTKTASATMHIPLPNLHLSNAEIITLRGRMPSRKKSTGYNVRIGDPTKGADPGPTVEPEPATEVVEGAEEPADLDVGDDDDDDDESSDSDVDVEAEDDDDVSDSQNDEYPDELAYSDPEVVDEDESYAQVGVPDDAYAHGVGAPYPEQLHYQDGRMMMEHDAYAQEVEEEDDDLAPMGGAIYPELD